MMSKIKNAITNHKYAVATATTGLMTTAAAFPAFAEDGAATATLSGTLSIFGEVFTWFLDMGADLLSWMLDKPIILCSLAIFFAGAVVGMLSRIYNAF